MDRGVVHQHVDPAERAVHLRRGRGEAVDVGDVQCDGPHAVAQADGGAATGVDVAAAEHDRVAARGALPDDLQAEPAVGPGHHDDPPVARISGHGAILTPPRTRRSRRAAPASSRTRRPTSSDVSSTRTGAPSAAIAATNWTTSSADSAVSATVQASAACASTSPGIVANTPARTSSAGSADDQPRAVAVGRAGEGPDEEGRRVRCGQLASG